ncbi:MAG: choice-of-anchor L domain-containing protein [Bacteroidales bacterium]
MKKIYFFIFICIWMLGSRPNAYSQAVDPDDFKVTQFKTREEAITRIKEVLLKGLEKEGLIENVKIIGKPEQLGYFENGQTLGFNTPSGIVICTGEASHTMGPNSLADDGQDMDGNGDWDCWKLNGSNKDQDSKDAAGILFYFYPASTSIKFNYVFGSEEYNEFVPKMNQRGPNVYNDTFGFFLSSKEDDNVIGPFSNKSKNIALVPLKKDYVSVKSINCGYEEYHKVTPPGKKVGGENFGNNCIHFINNDKTDRKYIQCDGYTKVFTAQQKVKICKKYLIKMVIADTRDGAFNSAVFLEEGSFDIGNVKTKQISKNAKVAGTAIRNCNEVEVKFSIPKQLDQEFPIPITYTDKDNLIGPYVVKNNDLGYCADEVVIKQSETTVSTFVSIENDQWGDDEYKTIKLEYPTNICDRGEPGFTTVTLRKINPIEPKVEVKFEKGDDISKYNDPNIDLECSKEATLTAEATGGYPNSLKYFWEKVKNNKTETEESIETKIFGDYPSTVELKVKGICQEETKKFIVNVGDTKLDVFTEDDRVCLDHDVVVSATTNSPLEYITWKDGDGNILDQGKKEITIKKIQKDMQVICQVPSGCVPDDFQEKGVSLKVIYPYADISPKNPLICPYETIELTANADLETNKGETYLWSTGETTQTIIVDPQKLCEIKEGVEVLDVDVTVTDICGNSRTASTKVQVRWDVKAKITCSDEDRLICGGDAVVLHGEGGQSVRWIENGVVVSTERDLEVFPPDDLNLTLEVEDHCIATEDITITVAPTPIIDLEKVIVRACTPAEILIRNHTGDIFDGALEYFWTMDGKHHSNDEDFEVILDKAGTHDVKLKVVSENECKAELDDPIEIEGYPHPESNIIHDYEEFILNREEYYFKSEMDNPKWIYDWLINGPTTSGSMEGTEVSYKFKEHGEFNIVLTITDENECSSEYKLEFLVQKLSAFAWIPTAFTPNGDGKNDMFYVKTMKKALDEFKMEIYNRWGELIYITTDPNAKWDGKVGGEYVDPGAYAVKVNITSVEGEKGEQKQLVFVIR